MTSTARWECVPAEFGVVHVTPIDALITHDLTYDCHCGPSSEMVPTASGADGWLTHRGHLWHGACVAIQAAEKAGLL